MTFLIDGYNVMHAVGLLHQKVPAARLERARTRFLDWLADSSRGRDALLRVVFDAQNGPGPSPETDHRGVWVRFAYRQTADDVIEELLARETRPLRITVVSNDTRLQKAGLRRGAEVLSCQEFVDWLIEDRRDFPPPAPPEPDKPEPDATPDEMAAWLAAFSTQPPKIRPKSKGRKKPPPIE